MTERIRQIHVMSDCTYGRARVQAELRDMGLCVNHKRIERLMRQAKLRGVSRRRGFVVTTHRNPQAKAAPDLVKRQFTATGINQLWVADMTYVPTWAGFLYLAVVVDVYSRKVVGWAFGQRMTSDLVIAALNMALHTRRPESVIHHSDQGSQYTSVAFGKRCEEMGGHLVCIETSNEELFVKSLCGQLTTWVGASDEETEGTWLWVHKNSPVKITMQIDNAGAADHHLALFTGLWHDGPAGSKYAYICEWEN